MTLSTQFIQVILNVLNVQLFLKNIHIHPRRTAIAVLFYKSSAKMTNSYLAAFQILVVFCIFCQNFFISTIFFFFWLTEH